MKKLTLLITLLLPLICNAQAHLGASENDIREWHSDKTFEVGYTNEGMKFIKTYMLHGTFVYFFDNETGLSKFCIQLVNDLSELNAQVEAYNKKYVIISDTKWKAYLEYGGILNIELIYNEDLMVHYFNYTN